MDWLSFCQLHILPLFGLSRPIDSQLNIWRHQHAPEEGIKDKGGIQSEKMKAVEYERMKAVEYEDKPWDILYCS